MSSLLSSAYMWLVLIVTTWPPVQGDLDLYVTV
jgi:hypothetical protein